MNKCLRNAKVKYDSESTHHHHPHHTIDFSMRYLKTEKNSFEVRNMIHSYKRRYDCRLDDVMLT